MSIRDGRLPEIVRALAIGFSPLAAWLIFAAIYYGYPLPNTSYAKLGMPVSANVHNGLLCLGDFLRCEPWHAVLLVLVPLAAILRCRRGLANGGAVACCVGVSIILQGAYFLYIGGDYMRGRFFTSALCLAALAGAYIVANPPRPMIARWRAAIVIALALLPISAWMNWHEPKFGALSGVCRLSSSYRAFEFLPWLKDRAWWRLSELLPREPAFIRGWTRFGI